MYIAYRLVNNKSVPNGGDVHIYILHANSTSQDFIAGDENTLPVQVKLMPSKNGNLVHAIAWYYAWDPRCVRGVFYRGISTADFKPGPIMRQELGQEITDQMAKDGLGYKDVKGIGIYGQMMVSSFELPDGSIDIAGEPYTYANVSEKTGAFNFVAGSIVNARIAPSGITMARVPRLSFRTGEIIIPFSDAGVMGRRKNGTTFVKFSIK